MFRIPPDVLIAPRVKRWRADEFVLCWKQWRGRAGAVYTRRLIALQEPHLGEECRAAEARFYAERPRVQTAGPKLTSA